jgi:tRNA dimethylallyltransferase
VIPVIVGPTASGKSRLAMELAEADPRIEIVSADSRQIYIGLDIGTAKPTPTERASVRHHLIDIVTPDRSYSAGEYAVAARAAIDGILERSGIPIVVGGTGFYIRALFEGLAAPAVPPEIYERLAERERLEGYEALYRELQAVDPEAAAAHPSANRQKMIRALACWIGTGRRYSSFKGEGELGVWSRRPRYLGMAIDRPELYRRVDERVDRMMEEGLLAETERILAAGYPVDAPGLRTVGYSELVRYRAGEFPLDRAVDLIKQSTRRYAKRQMTWFTRVEGVEWIEHGELIRRWNTDGHG